MAYRTPCVTLPDIVSFAMRFGLRTAAISL
jgi:hypothetical protein